MRQRLCRGGYAAGLGFAIGALGLGYAGVRILGPAKLEDVSLRTQRTHVPQAQQMGIPTSCESCRMRQALAGDLVGASLSLALVALLCIVFGYGSGRRVQK